jgi:hypothetical protein
LHGAGSEILAKNMKKQGEKHAFWAKFGRIYAFLGVFLALRWVIFSHLWRAGLKKDALRIVHYEHDRTAIIDTDGKAKDRSRKGNLNHGFRGLTRIYTGIFRHGLTRISRLDTVFARLGVLDKACLLSKLIRRLRLRPPCGKNSRTFSAEQKTRRFQLTIGY